MAQQTKTYLKARFKTGMKPTQQDYVDLIDSLVAVEDLESVNAATVDARINVYDTAQKAPSGYEAVTTIGDVLYVLRGFHPQDDVSGLLDQAGGAVLWENIQGKPAHIPVTWEQHTISLDNVVLRPVTNYESLGILQIVQEVAPDLIKNKKWVILDIGATFVPITTNPPAGLIYPVCRIRSVTIGIAPQISFPL